MKLAVLFLVLLGAVALSSAVPTGEEKPRRGARRDLSEQDHYLSEREQEEEEEEEHNPDYDHEAFLGREQAERFDHLAPGEASRRLGIIADKIDKNGDGYMDKEELVDWIRHVAHRYIYDDAERQWSFHERNNDNYISWDEYADTAYGMIEDHDDVYDHHRQLTYKQVMDRDRRRFTLADEDGNKALGMQEFANFLHPEEAPHMRDIVIDETMEDMDSNKDGYVTLEEYIEDLWPQYERDQEPDEPDWVAAEREQFSIHRDKDGDGRLDRKEIADWIMPEDYDHAGAEAQHLIFEADVNKDKKLTRNEILDSQDLFVGSQVTDFGDYLIRHDEF